MTDRKLRIVMIVLSLIGLGVATYLTVVHYAHITVACAANGNPCETVQHSAWSEIAGIPVALLGLIGYVMILGLLFAPQNDNVRTALLTVVLIGFGFSAYLTYREAFSIHAYCEWCLSSAVILTLLTGLSITRFLRGGDPVAAGGSSELEPGDDPDADEALDDAPVTGENRPADELAVHPQA